MSELSHKNGEQLLDKIVQQELPAITSTVKMLDKFVDDDVSSLSRLSEAILHDQALSSCVLKVANSATHFGITKVTTVSRATVMLGIHNVKNICLTSKIIDSLLQSKNLTPELYQHLSQTMAASFHAGILAKMMVPHHNEDTQEQIYLAAMLYRIGETAFWSSGDPAAEQLLLTKSLNSVDFDQECEQIIGITFNELSKGLAKAWNLDDLLIKAFDQPESRTLEVKLIYLADKLAQFIQSPPNTLSEFDAVIDKISHLLGVKSLLLRSNIEKARLRAIKLLNSYGASKLTRYIKKLPTIDDFSEYQMSETEQSDTAGESKEKALLNTVMQLTKLTQNSKDFNEFLLLTLRSITTNLNFDRCSFFMLNASKKQLNARFSVDKSGQNDGLSMQLNNENSSNLLAYAVKSNSRCLVNEPQSRQWQNYITKELAELIASGVICATPIAINGNCIGVISAQLFDKKARINTTNFNRFCFLVEHLAMCLTCVVRR